MIDIVIKFVQPNIDDDPSIISMAFEQCRLKYMLKPKWIGQDECLKLDTSTLIKTNVFIFDKFAGPAFDHLRRTKALIIGTRCLLHCLMEEKELPSWNNPIYSLALMGKTICCSGVDQQTKAKIIEYTQWMGGIFERNMTNKTTYLISNNVTSQKYISLAGRKPILKYDWIEAVWNESVKDTVRGICEAFIESSINEFRLPPFHGLIITTVNLTNMERQKIKTAIENNGGVYSGKFQSYVTDILIANESGINSKKYLAACSTKTNIIKPEWIYDSVEAHFAVPMHKYQIQKSKVSTPTKTDASLDLTSNFSMISSIGTGNNPETTVDDSHITMLRTPILSDSKLFVTPRTRNPIAAHANKVKSLFNMEDVGRAGLFLDGCRICVMGFQNEDKDFLYRIIKSGGAASYDEPLEEVSHIILNTNIDTTLSRHQNLKAHIVTIDWLIECVKQKQIVPEEYFTVNFNRQKSKRLYSSEYCDDPIEEISVRMEKINNLKHHTNLINSYKSSTSKSKFKSTITTGNRTPGDLHETLMTTNLDADCSSVVAADVTSVLSGATFFSNRIFFLKEDLEESLSSKLSTIILDAGGQILSDLKNANYIIVSKKIENEIPVPHTCHIVTPLFIKSCVKQQCEVELHYYHKPIILSVEKPLDGLVISVSSYKDQERLYIIELIQELGGVFSKNFVRRNIPEKNIKAATHLICIEPAGKKYEGCLNWGLPAVTVQWLLECYHTKKRALESTYLVGETKAPIRTKSDSTSNSSFNLESKVANNMSKLNLNNREMQDPSLKKDDNETSLKTLAQTSILHADDLEPKGSEIDKDSIFEELTSSSKENISLEVQDIPMTPQVSNALADRMVVNKHLSNVQSEGAGRIFSQTTPPPVRVIMRRLENGNSPETSGTPEVPKVPDWWKTPDTPYGAFLHGPNPSRSTRKRWKLWCENLPKPDSPLPPKPPSPTFSELKKELWDAILRPYNKQNQLDHNEDQIEADNNHLEQQSLSSPDSTSAIGNTPCKSPASIRKKLFLDADISGCNLLNESHNKSPACEGSSELLHTLNTSITNTDFDEMQPYRKRPPVFILSNVQDKEEVAQAILELGGTVLDINCMEYDINCSHILCDKIKSSEKLLAGIASGKWVLSTDYISHCIKENRFVEEDLYEWGNPKGEYTHALGNYIWRCKLNSWPEENVTGGAFVGWKVVFLCEKRESFIRIIQAGRGQIIECSDFKTLQEGTVTHCFLDRHKRTLTKCEISHLKRIGALILSLSYLNNYLLEDPALSPEKFILAI